MFVPTSRFYQRLMNGEGPNANYWGFYIIDVYPGYTGNDWSHMDYWHPQFKDCIYYFDSYDELEEMLKAPTFLLDTKNVRQKCPQIYEEIRRNSMQAWKEVLYQ